MNIKPPTTAAIIAAAARTISTMVKRFSALKLAERVLAIVVLAASLSPE
jgi:hypothetical protein